MDNKNNNKNFFNEKTRLLLACVVISVLVCGLFNFGLFLLAVKGLPENSQLNSLVNLVTPQKATVKIISEESAVIEAVKKADPAVVSIIVSKDLPILEEQYYNPFGDLFDDPFFDNFNFGSRYKQLVPNPDKTEKKEIGGGSGFMVTADGLVVTNKHVIFDSEAEYTVLINDGTKYETEILGRDPVNDIAILKIKQSEDAKKEFPKLDLGDSDQLQVGQSVIAIGNSLGEYRNTVSTGVVSGLMRDITAGDGKGSAEKLNGLIQTDAAINKGNSGGPLLNLQGEVVAVNVAIASNAENVGFAIPINTIKQTIQTVIEKGKIMRPMMGVRYIPVTKTLQEKNNLKVDYGALVLRGEQEDELAVMPGSPADKAGIVEYDIILEINGQKIDQDNPLSKEILKYQVDQEITVKILHKGEEKEVKLKLSESAN